jgi:hypothetical protein
MNMKKLFVASLIVLFAVSANAQFKIGIQGGLNVASMKITDADLKSLMGFRAGLIADLSLGPIGVQPGILFSQKGAKASSGDGKITLNYIDVPVYLLYKIGLPGAKVLLMAGPNFGYALNGKTPDGDIEFGSGDNQLKKLDLGLGLGAGVQFLKLQGTVNYTMGLTNLSNYSGETVKNNVLSISLAFFF